MKYLETIVRNNSLIRQKFVTGVERNFFVKNVNCYIGKSGLTSFWYDDYCDGKGTEGFSAQWVEDGMKCKVTISFMSDDAIVNLMAVE